MGHQLWLEKVNIQDRIFVNSNRKDMTLKGVNLFTDFDRQLGEQAVDNFASNAVYVNFSQALKNELNFGLLHGYYVGVIPEKVKIFSIIIKLFFMVMMLIFPTEICLCRTIRFRFMKLYFSIHLYWFITSG